MEIVVKNGGPGIPVPLYRTFPRTHFVYVGVYPPSKTHQRGPRIFSPLSRIKIRKLVHFPGSNLYIEFPRFENRR